MISFTLKFRHSLGESQILDDEATVEMALIYSPGDPFSTGYRNIQTASLVKQNGAWKLSSMPQYNFWAYNWYVEEPK